MGLELPGSFSWAPNPLPGATSSGKPLGPQCWLAHLPLGGLVAPIQTSGDQKGVTVAMRNPAIASLLILVCNLPVPAQTVPSGSALVGTWKVDLRPSPDAPPYLQEFVVTKVTDEKTFEGTFYGTPVSQARINTKWGAVRIAFVTTDASGPYNHSAVLNNGTLEGLTNSTGRDFLAYWSASR